MYGNYAWNAGATAGNVQQDLVALICGADVASLSADCNKAATVVSGEASGWLVVDQPYGVLRHQGLPGGPGMTARITLSATPRVQVAAVDKWNMGTHAAAYVTSAYDGSATMSGAGSMNIMASDAGLLLASSDWSFWVLIGEVKRDGPALAGDVEAPGTFMMSSSGYCYMPRLKSPSAVGDLSNASVNFQSAYGSLSSSAARNRKDELYLPMTPGVLSYSSVPVGEIKGVVIVGGYGQGGDFVLDGAGKTYQIVKYSSTSFAVPKV
jgi:hypothetical protein